jgi:hypothetical protein
MNVGVRGTIGADGAGALGTPGSGVPGEKNGCAVGELIEAGNPNGSTRISSCRRRAGELDGDGCETRRGAR